MSVLAERRCLEIDWNAMAEGLQSTSDPLYKHVSAVELDRLVGWATNVTNHSDDNALSSPNLLTDLPSSPLMASILYIIHEEATALIANEKSAKFDHLVGAFDQSSLVSLGICIEDILTASFLPLAEAHMRICKREDEIGEVSTRWTMPPEECILAIAKQEGQSKKKASLPTVSPPVLTAVPGEKPQSILNLPLESDDTIATRDWAKSHNLSVAFMEDNKDLFDVFRNSTSH